MSRVNAESEGNHDVVSGIDTSGSEREFSGFGDSDVDKQCSEVEFSAKKLVAVEKDSGLREYKIPKRGKVKGKQETKKSGSKKKTKQGKKKDNSSFDITKLSENDLTSLRQALGFPGYEVPEHYDDSERDYFQSPLGPLENLPNIHVQISEDDAFRPNSSHKNKNVARKMVDALFDDSDKDSVAEFEEKEWSLPRLKTPEKSKAINSSLANLINTACVEQCDIDKEVQKYKIPENCKISPPLVNKEIWKILDKRTQAQDRCFQDIQELVAASIVPIIRLSEILKPHVNANLDAKSLFSDALTILGQLQLNLSLRRRYMIRPNLKRKYFNLCNVDTPITDKLFGDDLAKEIKNCDALSYIGKEQRYPSSYSRGRGYGNQYGFGKAPRRGFQSSSYHSARSHPYYNTQPYQRGGMGRQYSFGSRGFGRGKKMASATATCPNDLA